MKVNLKIIDLKEFEYLILLMVIDMKENLKMEIMKDMEYFIFLQDLNMKGTLKKDSLKVFCLLLIKFYQLSKKNYQQLIEIQQS